MPNTKKLVLQCLCPLLLLTAPNLNAEPKCSQVVAKVASAQGVVVLRAYQSREWRRVYSDEPICAGSTIKTLVRSRATLIESSLAVITLDQHSTLTFVAPPAPEKVSSWFLNLIEGRFLFRSRETQKLNIQTPFINAVHEGTEFIVAVNDKKAEISVLDGQVAGENSAGKIKIAKGYKGVAEAGQPPVVNALTITPEDAVQWALYYPPIIDTTSQAQAGASVNSALTAYRQGDIAEALAKLDQVPTLTQDRIQHHLLKSGLLLSTGRLDEAQPLIDHVLQQQPNNSEALALQSIIAVTKNQQDHALNLAKKAVSNNPRSAVAQIAQSYAQQALFNLDDALKSAQEATRLTPENALAWARVSELQLSQGDHAAALASAQKARAANPKLARTQTILGFAHLAETKISNAQHAFQDAISLDSSDPLARLGLGLAKIRQGEVEDGKTELETAVNLDPNNALVRSYLGKAYYELRNKDYAGKEYEIAKQMDPKDPTPYFYDAILKQTTNRPVEALHDMQKAIELNDNRGVYRSKLLLDKDTATRQVGLGRIFNNLGFDDPANRQAMNSLAIDPSNYSAHRLLSDSYLIKPHHELARSSEHLQSQLLQPLNYNPIQPSLAYTDLNIIKGIGPNNTSFNEYNRMFERNGIRFTTTGIAGSNSTFGDETALAGIYNKFSFSLGQLHYETDGFRQNNDLKHDIYNAFAQYEITPELNVQAEFRHRETEHGDLEIQGDPGIFRDFKRRNLDQDTYRFGLKYSPAVHSDLLVSFIHANREERIQNDGSSSKTNTHSYNFESQYIFHNEKLNTVLGGGLFRTENDNIDSFNGDTFSNNDTSHYVGYFYSNYKLFEHLNITAGLSFDHYHDNNVWAEQTENELNPKLGFIWQANDYLTFRAAGFKTTKSAIIDNQTLQPTQIAGFNQFFDDVNGAVAWQYGAGVDVNTHKDVYLGAEAFKRDLKIPTGNVFQGPNQEIYRFYANWSPHDNWAFNSEFRFENFRSDGSFPPFPKFVETFYLPTEIRFFHQVGFFATLKGTYVSQKTRQSDLFAQFGDEGFNSDFYLVDVAVGYRFPKQYGLISVEAKNLFDTNFQFRDRTFLGNENRSPDFYPERMVFAKITFNY